MINDLSGSAASVAGMTPGLPDDVLAALQARSKSDDPCDFAPANPQPPGKPLSARRIERVERELGLALPSALRAFYGQVANGGVGPGYGLIGLRGGVKSDLDTDVVDDYRLRLQNDEEDPAYFWPPGVLPVCHWGCAVYSCIDCRSPEARVLRFDPNPVDQDWTVAWGSESESLTTWLRRWLAGEEQFESGTPDGSFSIER